MRTSLIAVAAASALFCGFSHAESATYTIEPTHTFATFEIGHFGAGVNRGRFDKKEGSVQLDKAAKTGKVEITFETSSINTGTPAFEKHLQSADLFNAAQFPTFKFVGTDFKYDGEKVTSVGGELTLLGKTGPVTLTAKQFNCYQSPMLKREVCGGDFEATIDRTQWGMNYGVDWGFPKNVHLLLSVEAIKQ
jgi:polyisoprenoid-binding protein YceI